MRNDFNVSVSHFLQLKKDKKGFLDLLKLQFGQEKHRAMVPKKGNQQKNKKRMEGFWEKITLF